MKNHLNKKEIENKEETEEEEEEIEFLIPEISIKPTIKQKIIYLLISIITVSIPICNIIDFFINI